MRVIWVVLSAYLISGGKTQPTSVDWNHRQDNAALRFIPRMTDLLVQQNKLLRTLLRKFVPDEHNYAKIIQDRLTLLEKSLNGAIYRFENKMSSFEKTLSAVTQLLVESPSLQKRYDENYKQITTALTNLTGQTNEDLFDQISLVVQDMITAIEHKLQGLPTEGSVAIADGILRLVSLFQERQNTDIMTLLQNNSISQNESIRSNVHDNKDVIYLKMDQYNETIEDILNATTSGECGSTVTQSVYTQEGTIRLVNGPTLTEGRAEIFYEGEWGIVCIERGLRRLLRVACRQMGFCGGEVKTGSRYWVTVDDPSFLYFSCGGEESSLIFCNKTHNFWGQFHCKEDVGVSCVRCS